MQRRRVYAPHGREDIVQRMRVVPVGAYLEPDGRQALQTPGVASVAIGDRVVCALFGGAQPVLDLREHPGPVQPELVSLARACGAIYVRQDGPVRLAGFRLLTDVGSPEYARAVATGATLVRGDVVRVSSAEPGPLQPGSDARVLWPDTFPLAVLLAGTWSAIAARGHCAGRWTRNGHDMGVVFCTYEGLRATDIRSMLYDEDVLAVAEAVTNTGCDYVFAHTANPPFEGLTPVRPGSVAWTNAARVATASLSPLQRVNDAVPCVWITEYGRNRLAVFTVVPLPEMLPPVIARIAELLTGPRRRPQ